MQIKTIILITALIISPLTALAGGDHGHSHGEPAITQSVAVEFAKNQVTRLVENGKIEKSWKPAIIESSEQRTYGHKTEWAVAFKNSKASDPAKSVLYIFLSAKGKFLAANFTGK